MVLTKCPLNESDKNRNQQDSYSNNNVSHLAVFNRLFLY